MRRLLSSCLAATLFVGFSCFGFTSGAQNVNPRAYLDALIRSEAEKPEFVRGEGLAQAAKESSVEATAEGVIQRKTKGGSGRAGADLKRRSRVERGDGADLIDPWWKHAVIYEIYPRSFADAKNCGIGNLKGITQKLDYLKDLGIDAIWLTPCYPSPQVDFGYDISDYCGIAPEYGTLADFDELVKEAKKRNIKIIMDLVMNHTSDKHPWFIESRSSRDNPKRDWYIWSDGKDGKSPNNWQSLFGHSAWQWNPETKQYYYHFFYVEQPDLNYRNPEVKRAMYDVARFWLDRGVAGFRLDAIGNLFEVPDLRDNPVLPGKNAYGDSNMLHKNNYLLPEVHDVLKELRSVLNSYPDHPVLLGETAVDELPQLYAMYGKNNDEIQLPMDFRFAYVNKLYPSEFRKRIAEIDKNGAGGQPTFLFSNHDVVRHYNRYGDGKHNDQIAKLMATLLLTTRATPLMYYGEELGMQNNDPVRKEDVQDPIGKIGWPKEKGRDGERTPMQWNAEANAGFSTCKPWLPVAHNYKTHNVAAELKDPDSIFNFYKKLLRLRKTNAALRNGEYVPLNENDQNVLAYARKQGVEVVLVVLNMSDKKQDFTVDLKPLGSNAKGASILLTSGKEMPPTISTGKINLAPFAAVVTQLK